MGYKVVDLGRPVGWTADECDHLEVLMGFNRLQNGEVVPSVNFVVEFDLEDLELLQRNGRRFWVSLTTQVMPPVSFAIYDPEALSQSPDNNSDFNSNDNERPKNN